MRLLPHSPGIRCVTKTTAGAGRKNGHRAVAIVGHKDELPACVDRDMRRSASAVSAPVAVSTEKKAMFGPYPLA